MKKIKNYRYVGDISRFYFNELLSHRKQQTDRTSQRTLPRRIFGVWAIFLLLFTLHKLTMQRFFLIYYFYLWLALFYMCG